MEQKMSRKEKIFLNKFISSFNFIIKKFCFNMWIGSFSYIETEDFEAENNIDPERMEYSVKINRSCINEEDPELLGIHEACHLLFWEFHEIENDYINFLPLTLKISMQTRLDKIENRMVEHISRVLYEYYKEER